MGSFSNTNINDGREKSCRCPACGCSRAHRPSPTTSRSITKPNTNTFSKYNSNDQTNTFAKYNSNDKTNTFAKYNSNDKTHTFSKYNSNDQTHTFSKYNSNNETNTVAKYNSNDKTNTFSKYNSDDTSSAINDNLICILCADNLWSGNCQLGLHFHCSDSSTQSHPMNQLLLGVAWQVTLETSCSTVGQCAKHPF